MSSEVRKQETLDQIAQKANYPTFALDPHPVEVSA